MLLAISEQSFVLGSLNDPLPTPGRVMYDSLKVFGLGYSASYAEVKALYRTYARTYHPDQHRSERTGMTDEAAMRFFQLVNNAHNYLTDKLN